MSMNEKKSVEFDSVSYVGIPSRPTFEPMSLEQVHVNIAMANKSAEIAGRRNTDPKGHRVVVFDMGQLANLTVASGGKDSLPPGELPKILEPDSYDYLRERLLELRPVADRIRATHDAVAKALNLAAITPFSTSSMEEDPEQLFHNPGFRILLGALWGNRDTFLNIRGGHKIRLRDHLLAQLPLKYKQPNAKGSTDGYLAYGILETAGLIHPAHEHDLHVLQYSHSRERYYWEIARAVLLQILHVDPEVSNRLELVPGASGLTVDGFEEDSYRVAPADWQAGRRLCVNPPPTIDDLKTALLNGQGRFNPNRMLYIRDHVLRLLVDAERILNIGPDEQRRIGEVFMASGSGVNGIEPVDAEFILETLHRCIIDPIRQELELKGLIYAPPAADVDVEGGDDSGQHGGPSPAALPGK